MSDAELAQAVGDVVIRTFKGVDTECKGTEYVLPNALAGVSRGTICVDDPDNLWGAVEKGFFRRLHEFVYHWAGRTLHNLQFEVVKPDNKCLSYHISSPLDGYKIPYCHLYFVKCDSLETYRAVVRPRLKAWVDDMKHNSNGLGKSEFLIVFIPDGLPPGSPASDSKQAMLINKKVLDKISADFGGSKSERVCKLQIFGDFQAVSSATNGQASATNPIEGEWGEFLKKICSRVVASFEARCARIEDQIVKLESQIELPGWNYCTYLVVKEGLAFTWIQLGQYYDALRIFDSLRVQFDELTDTSRGRERASSQLNIELYKAQVLRVLLRNDDAEENSAGEAGGTTKIIGNAERRLSYSLSFGPKGEQLSADTMNRKGSLLLPTDNQVLSGGGDTEGMAAESPMSIGDKTISPSSVGSDSNENAPPTASKAELYESIDLIHAVLLDVKRKPYREQIHKSNVSILEIRLYLFVRSTLLLFTTHCTVEALRRALHFIAAFSKDLVKAAESAQKQEGDLSYNETRVIAMAWSFSACLEILCASHVSNAATEHFEQSTDMLLFQSELMAFAAQSFEQLIRLCHPDGGVHKPSSTLLSKLSVRAQGSDDWLCQLPHFLLTGDDTTHSDVVDLARLQSWCPVGVHEALRVSEAAAKLLSKMLEGRAMYLSAAKRFRAASRIEYRRASLCAIHGRFDEARSALRKIYEFKSCLDTWPILLAEVQLLKLFVAVFDNSTLIQVVHTCLETLCLSMTLHEQRLEALELLGKTLVNMEAFRVSGKKYPLLKARVSRKPGRMCFRSGEAVSFPLEMYSRYPQTITFCKVYVRLKRVEQAGDHFPEPAIQKKKKSGNVNGLVKYRSSDTPIDANSIFENAVQSHEVDLSSILVDSDEEDDGPEMSDVESLSSCKSARLSAGSRQDSNNGSMALLDLTFDDNDGDPPGDLPTTPANPSPPPLGFRASTAENVDTKFMYVQASDVVVDPGYNEPNVVARPKSVKYRCLYQPGQYIVDRIVYRFDSLDMVTRVKATKSKAVSVFIDPMPQLFEYDIVSPREGFIALNDATDSIEVKVRIKSCLVKRFPRVQSLRIFLDFLELALENSPLTLIKDDSSYIDFEVSNDEVDSDGRPLGEHFFSFKVRIDPSESNDVDKIIIPQTADTRVLRRKGLNRFSSNAVASFNLKVESEVLLLESDINGKSYETPLSQVGMIPIRYGAAFEISQCVRYCDTQLWFTISLKSNLPYKVVVSEYELESAKNVSKTCKPMTLAPNHELYLTFHMDLIDQPVNISQHKLKFSASYKFLCNDTEKAYVSNDTVGYFCRTISFTQTLNKPCLDITSCCMNVQSIMVGSTATFRFRVGTELSSTTVVESKFATPSVEAINVSTSPIYSRAKSFQLVEPKDDEESSECFDGDTYGYLVVFDPMQWMIIGAERGRINITKQRDVYCELIPLRSGDLPFPVLEICNMTSGETPAQSFLQVIE
mmetsp:Transcript_7487/g.16306  ORF Transcript_7487/g.16306 Transcript_7487/m.16306 type:complete len:1466 (-) Transcript_7487:6-4403(-)